MKGGILQGERVAFTGRLATVSRKEAIRRVEAAGGVPVESVSRRTSRLVIGMAGWPLLPDGSVSRQLERAEKLNQTGAGIRITPEQEFFDSLEREPSHCEPKTYAAAEVCGLLGVDRSTLGRWEHFGLIRSTDGRFDFQDMVSLRTVADLVRSGVRPDVIARSIRRLSAFLPGTDRPLAQLKFVAESPRKLVAELTDRLLAPDGQLLLDLDGSLPPPEPLRFLAGESQTAADWLERGETFEEAEKFTEAEAAYREAIAIEPTNAIAYFHLASARRALGKDEAAEELYRVALAHDPSLATAWYNIADLREEWGEIEGAISCLRSALEIDTDYADAHYNLALLLERSGRRNEARQHWSAYLRLDPCSEWGANARQHLARMG